MTALATTPRNRKKRLYHMFLLTGVLLLHTGAAKADGRDYVFSYEWKTMPQGEWEFEWYFDHRVAEFDRSEHTSDRHQLEIEYGVTDRLDLGAYIVFRDRYDQNDTDYKAQKVKFRTRYRIGEHNQFLMNPLLYLEYQRSVDGTGEDIGEAKLILDRHFGRWDLVLNFQWEGRIDVGGTDEYKAIMAGGYEISPKLHVGAELQTVFDGGEEKILLGPSVRYAFSHRFWAAIGAGFGLNDNSRDMDLRTILGVRF